MKTLHEEGAALQGIGRGAAGRARLTPLLLLSLEDWSWVGESVDRRRDEGGGGF